MFADRWVFEDHLLNTADKLVSCSDHDPSFALPYFSGFDCLVSADVTEPGCRFDGTTDDLICQLSATGLGGSTEPGLYAVDFRPQTDGSPFNVTMMGATRQGVEFCCHYREKDLPIDQFVAMGSDLSDTIIFHHEATATELTVAQSYVELFDGTVDYFMGSNTTEDWVVGGDGYDAIFPLDGDDFVYGGADGDFIVDGYGQDYVYGEGGADVLISVDSTNSLDFLYGGAAGDILCSFRADDSLIANNSPGSTNYDQIFLQSTAGGNVCNGSSAGNSSNAECGNSGTWSSAVTCGGVPWAGASGTSCDYTLTTRPTVCEDWISP